jgi:hypothetical protein
MKITDKDALERVRVILQDCSPTARTAIQDLVQKLVGGTKRPTPPPPRNMNPADLKVVDSPATVQRQAPKIYDPNKEYDANIPIDGEEAEGDWLDNWLK